MCRNGPRRMGSGDLPGLQSRRFGSSRVEWWIRLPHASAKSFVISYLEANFTTLLIDPTDWSCPIRSIASRCVCGITWE